MGKNTNRYYGSLFCNQTFTPHVYFSSTDFDIVDKTTTLGFHMVIEVPWDELLLSQAVMAKAQCDRTNAQPRATSAQPQPKHTSCSSTDLSSGTTAQRTAPESLIQAIKRRKNKPKNAATENKPMARSLRMFAQKAKERSKMISPAQKVSKAKAKTAKTPAPRKKGKMQLAISPQTGVHNPRQYLLLSFCPPRRRRTEVPARLDRVICQSGATDKVRAHLSFFLLCATKSVYISC